MYDVTAIGEALIDFIPAQRDCALKEAERYNIRVERAHSSSASALENVLQGCC